MTILTHGTAFTSYDAKATKITKEEISEEKVSFDDTIKKTNEAKNVAYHTTTQSDEAKATTFIDPKTQKYVIVSLENTILDKLREKFGADDVVEKEDGSIRLTDKAEAFVAGWFADIAYKREFLKSDRNHDGHISEDEYDKTRNNFGIEGLAVTEYSLGEERLLVAGEKIIKGSEYSLSSRDMISQNRYGVEKKIDTISYRNDNIAISLDDELNTTLLGDIDFDGKISLIEAYSVNGGDAQDIMFQNLKEWGISTIPSELDTSDFNHVLNFILDIFLQKNDKEQKELMKKLYEKLENSEKSSKEVINKFYTQENLEQIKRLRVDREFCINIPT